MGKNAPHTRTVKEKSLHAWNLFRFPFSSSIATATTSGATNYMSDMSPNFSLYPGTVHLPFFTIVSIVSTIRGCAWPTSSTCVVCTVSISPVPANEGRTVRSSKGRASWMFESVA